MVNYRLQLEGVCPWRSRFAYHAVMCRGKWCRGVACSWCREEDMMMGGEWGEVGFRSCHSSWSEPQR